MAVSAPDWSPSWPNIESERQQYEFSSSGSLILSWCHEVHERPWLSQCNKDLMARIPTQSQSKPVAQDFYSSSSFWKSYGFKYYRLMRFGKKAKNVIGCHQVTDFVSVRHRLLVYYYFETNYWFSFQTRIISSFRNLNHLNLKENATSQRASEFRISCVELLYISI